MAIQYNLSVRKLNSERIRYKTEKGYEAFSAKLGHHPTIRELLQNKEGKKIFYAIKRQFGTLDKFKTAHGYPLPEKEDIVGLRTQEKALVLYKDYVKLGMALKVATKYNMCPSRVSQILRWGNAKGLFKYPPDKPNLLPHITPEKLKEDYITYGSIDKLAAHYGVTPGKVDRLAKKHNLSIRKMVTERAKKRLFEDYKEILTNLGHRPTTTEIQRLSKSLYSRILHHYKSIDNFRKAYRYPKPTGKYSKKI